MLALVNELVERVADALLPTRETQVFITEHENDIKPNIALLAARPSVLHTVPSGGHEDDDNECALCLKTFFSAGIFIQRTTCSEHLSMIPPSLFAVTPSALYGKASTSENDDETVVMPHLPDSQVQLDFCALID